MTLSAETRESLLVRVRDPSDALGWQQFVTIYRPMIYRIARRRGLQDSDAEDLSQRVLLSVSHAIVDWQKDPERGSFRGWLTRVARNAIINHITRGPRDVAVGGTDFLVSCQAIPAGSDEINQLIGVEYARSRLRAAASRVKENVTGTTWDAFWMTTVQGKSVAEVADCLSLSTGAVYGARGRVMKQLQMAAENMDAENMDAESMDRDDRQGETLR